MHFDNDPLNCGACGHDCEGGECMQGRCQPVVLGKGDEKGFPSSLVLDTNKVYWSIATLAPLWTASGIYWCDHSQCGAAPSSFVSSAVNPKTMTLVASRTGGPGTLYWTDITAERIRSCPAGKLCDMPANVADSGPGPLQIIENAGVLYWAVRGTAAGYYRDGQIMSCAADNCASSLRVIATDQWEPGSVAVDSDSVYWTAKYGDAGTQPPQPVGSILSCLKNYSCGKDGGRAIVTYQLSLTSILIHQGFLYWTQGPTETQGDYVACLSNGSIMRCQLPVCAPVHFARNMRCPSSLTVNEDRLYWATSLGLFGGAGEIQHAPVSDGSALKVFETTPDPSTRWPLGPQPSTGSRNKPS